MALDKRLQNPKRSLQDPTENNARFAVIEKELERIQGRLEDLEREKRMRSGCYELGVR